jgi:hypothetical protein
MRKSILNRNIFWTAFALALLFSAAACEQAAGTGSTTERTLRAAVDLAKIGVDPDYPLDGTYTLGADLTLADWTPIGTADEPFAGTFNGKGRTLTIAGSGGLFGFAKGAVISNVTVAGTISAVAPEDASVFVGGIVGNGENTAISFCASHADIAAEGHNYNSSAGGIAGNLRSKSTITDCYATGTITMRCDDDLFMLSYTGGIVGYQGTGTAAGTGGVDNSSDCIIARSYFTGNVYSWGSFPYAGGIAGYNYCSSVIRECYAQGGTVTATGTNLPYAGGISGYNSRMKDNPAVIENCHSDMTVNAVSASQAALAGGITSANAADAVVSKCYALGAVIAAVDGSGTGNLGGSMGVPLSANAGGIAGSQYFDAPSIQNCAALNQAIRGEDSGSGALYNVHRIAGTGSGSHQSAWTANMGNVAALTADGAAVAVVSDTGGYDGADCDAKPDQAAYEALGWDFSSVWKMGADGYPVLQWQ